MEPQQTRLYSREHWLFTVPRRTCARISRLFMLYETHVKTCSMTVFSLAFKGCLHCVQPITKVGVSAWDGDRSDVVSLWIRFIQRSRHVVS